MTGFIRAASSTPSNARLFQRRLVSFVGLWAVLLAVMLPDERTIGDSILLTALLIVALAGQAEFYGLCEKQGQSAFKWAGLICGALLIVGDFFVFRAAHDPARQMSMSGEFETGLVAVTVMILGTGCLFAVDRGAGTRSLAFTVFGLLYVPWLMNFMQKTYFLPGIQPHGRLWLIYLMAVTKLGDSGAHLVGTFAGRHPLAPRISPGKTWEGFAGALVVSALVSLAFAMLAGDRLPGLTLLHAAMLGIVLGLAAVAGDLIESLFKREAGVKDSGSLFPGIGGVLDLIDSLLFTAPILYLYLRCVLLPL